MKSFLISDNRDTHVGMRLAGITGVIVHEREKILKELDKCLRDKDIGLVIITDKIFKKVEDKIIDIKLKRNNPLIVVIPDRHGYGYKEDIITKYIKESIGLKI